MNNKILKALLFALAIIFLSAQATALSLFTAFDNGITTKTIEPGQSATYYISTVGDQGMTDILITAKLYDYTTGQYINLGTIFTTTTTQLFYNSPALSITPSNYNNLPGNYRLEIRAEQHHPVFGTTLRSESLYLEVTGNRLPHADFTFTPTNPSTDDTVTFTSNSTDDDGTIVREEWFVNGASIGTGRIMQHRFTQPGTFNVRLLVTDNEGGQSERIKQVVVTQGIIPNIPPRADFFYAPLNPVVNQQVLFTSNSTDIDGTIVSYEWRVNGTVVGNTPVFSRTFTAAGTYAVRLTVTDNDGATGTATKNIVVARAANIPPVADFNYTPQNPRVNERVTFTSTSYDPDGSIVAYTWKVDGEIIISEGTRVLNYTFAQPGAHLVVLAVTDNLGATATKNRTVMVSSAQNAPPIAEFNYTPPNPRVNDRVLFTSISYDPDGTIIREEWHINGQIITVGRTMEYTFTQPGEYSVVLFVTDNLNATTARLRVVRVTASPNQPPIASFTYTPAHPMEGQRVAFTSTSYDPDGTLVSELWFVDGVQFASGRTAQRIFDNEGTYSVMLRVTDNDGATAEAARTIEVGRNISRQLVLDELGCNPNVVRGNIQHCSAHEQNDVTNVTITFKYSRTNEILGSCQTNSEGYCHINPVINKSAGTYEVYAIAEKNGYDPDLTMRLRTSFRVWEMRYVVENLELFEDPFITEQYEFYRGNSVYASFDVLDTFTNRYLTPNSGIMSQVLMRINNANELNFTEWEGAFVLEAISESEFENMKEESADGGSFISDLADAIISIFTSDDEQTDAGAFKYVLRRIPLSDDYLGTGKVFAFAFNFSDHTAGQGHVDVTVLNNPLQFNPPEAINFTRPIMIDMKQYLRDVETLPEDVVMEYDVISGDINIARERSNVFLVSPSQTRQAVVEFIADDTDGSVVSRRMLFTVFGPRNETNETDEVIAILKMPSSTLQKEQVTLDGSESYDTKGMQIVEYNWRFFLLGQEVESMTTTTSAIEKAFDKTGRFTVRLTVKTEDGRTGSTEAEIYVGRQYGGVVIGREDGLFVQDFTVIGSEEGTIRADEMFEVKVSVKNDLGRTINDLKVTFAIPELGYRISGPSFDIKGGKTEHKTITGELPFDPEEIEPGEYIALIGVAGDGYIRTKYYPLIIER